MDLEQGIRFIEKAIGAETAVFRNDESDDDLDIDENFFGVNSSESNSIKQEKPGVRPKREKFDLKKTSSQVLEDILVENEVEKSKKRKRVPKPDDENLEQLKRQADAKSKEKVLKRLKTQICENGMQFSLMSGTLAYL